MAIKLLPVAIVSAKAKYFPFSAVTTTTKIIFISNLPLSAYVSVAVYHLAVCSPFGYGSAYLPKNSVKLSRRGVVVGIFIFRVTVMKSGVPGFDFDFHFVFLSDFKFSSRVWFPFHGGSILYHDFGYLPKIF
jgi:hypothetical protein